MVCYEVLLPSSSSVLVDSATSIRLVRWSTDSPVTAGRLLLLLLLLLLGKASLEGREGGEGGRK